MGLLTPTRRVYHKWRNVLPIYDGRSCPDCGAVVCGREDRRRHRELHMHTEEWQEEVWDALMRIARAAGLPTIEPEHRGQADDDGRVDLRAESLDDRLTRKAQTARRAPEYDEDDEDDE